MLHEGLGLHLFSARSDHYKAGMHPLAVLAETVHHTSVIPDYPISSDNGFAYVVRTDELASKDVEKPWTAVSKTSMSLTHCIITLIYIDTIPFQAEWRRKIR